MKAGIINIKGQIGSDIDEVGNIVTRGVELVDVIVQAQAIQSDATEVNIPHFFPGGYLPTGDQIAEYIEGLKAKYKVNTVQVGPIGSIATKLFMKGEKRTLNPKYDFFIHNPWTDPGPVDANQAARVTVGLQNAKQNLLNFYIASTGKRSEDLEPLMDLETSLTAEQALALGFATEIKTEEMVFASIQKPKKMTATENFLALIEKGIKALQGKEIKALALQLEGGKVAESSAMDEAGLPGSTLTVDGAAAPDGEHKLTDGRVVVVSGGAGVIAEIKPAVAPADPNAQLAQTVAAQGVVLNKLAESVSALVQAKVDESKKFNEELIAIKAQVTNGKQPPKGGQFNGGAKEDHRPGSIFDKRREEIKAQQTKK